MPIDDPIAQAKTLIASDERQSVNQSLLNLFDKIPVLGEAMSRVAEPLRMIGETVQRRKEENVCYLLDVVTEEVQRLNRDVAAMSVNYQKFIATEWVELVIDGMERAHQTRAKDRIARMGRALAYAFEEGDKRPPDLTEEMLRVAMSLDDDDVRVLRWLCDGMEDRFSSSTGRVDHESVNNFWGQINPDGITTRSGGEPATPTGLSIGEVMSACAKLQSFGLVVQMRQNSGKVSPATFGPLKKGYDFIQYIRSQS